MLENRSIEMSCGLAVYLYGGLPLIGHALQGHGDVYATGLVKSALGRAKQPAPHCVLGAPPRMDRHTTGPTLAASSTVIRGRVLCGESPGF